jgi:hypothetical protein
MPDEKITLREFALDLLIEEIEIEGEKTAIMKRCQDRHFCQDIGVNYNSVNIYGLIKKEKDKYLLKWR